MQSKHSISPALWFIPLLAVCLTLVVSGVFFVGKFFWKHYFRPSHSLKPVVEQPQSVPAAPVVPLASLEQLTVEEPSVPSEILEQQPELQPETVAVPTEEPEVCPAPAVPLTIAKPRRRAPATPFERGLRQCKKYGVYPCAWEDDSRGIRTQYWVMSENGPIQRGVYDMGGNLQNETIATLGGTVMSYTDATTAWYFEAGALIKIRTSPYDNCNLHDWFFINEDGKQDVCQCAYGQPNCCARSPYREGTGFGYCELFPIDKDFCK